MHTVSILSIAKDENEYLEEFVTYYLSIGIEHFYIYDNESSIPAQNILHRYLDVCTIVPIKGAAMQIPAYNHFLTHFRHETEWVAVFDIDEYLFLKKHDDIREFVKDVGKNADCIGVNWKIFGNGKHIVKPQFGTLIENYIYSEGVQHPNIKSISRTSAIRKFTHPHFPNLKWFRRSVNAKGNKIRGAENHEDCTDIVQLNHYFTKSLEEYREKLFHKKLPDSGLIRADDPKNLEWMLKEPEKTSVYLDNGLKELYLNRLKYKCEI